jgi:TonB-dependent starch-binding outer membrane protein SusC
MYKIYTNNGCMPSRYIKKFLLVMKITTFLLFAAFMQVSASGLAQRLTLVQKDATLKQIFKEINKQTGYNIYWSDSQLNSDQKVNVNFKDTPLLGVLDKCLENTQLTYTVENKTVVIKEKGPTVLDKIKAVLSIPITVTGKVTDSLGTPLIGASIINKNTKKSVISDEKGDFNISGQVGDVISISYIGYKAVDIKIDNKTSFLSVILHTSVGGLKEVIVSTGYQDIPIEQETGSVSTVDNTLFNRHISTDVIGKLDGIVPGLIFNKNTYTSNNGYDINIDGRSTLFSNDQPLIVVDNFPYNGDLNNLNPNDIESVTILKDAASASIWGVRSGNGVIVLTTKKGKRNQKLDVSINANVTIGEKPNLFYGRNFLDANDYINVEQKLFSQGWDDATISNPLNILTPVVQLLSDERSGLISAASANSQINALRNVDVRQQLSNYFYQKSATQQYSVNFKGGSENSDYYFSLGEDHGIANQVGNSNNRITIKSLLNFYPTKNLTLTAGINYAKTDATNNSSLGSQFQVTYPYEQLVGANGTSLAIPMDISSQAKSNLTQQRLLDWQFKPLAEIGLNNNTTNGIDNLINLGANYKILPGFSADVKYQYENANLINKNDNSVDTYFARNLINNYTQINSDGSLTYPIPIGGILMENQGKLTSQDVRAQLNFNHDWNHGQQFNMFAGAEVSQTVNESYQSIVYGYDNSTYTSYSNIDYADNFSFSNPSLGTARIPNPTGLSKTTNNFVSYFTNAGYTFADKYIFSASARIDKSNLFGVNTNQKAVPLYSLGIAWDLTKEKFFDINWVTLLKPRITYGYTANINTQATAITTIEQQSGFTFTNLNYATIASPGNPELRWEKDRKTNFGIDFALKNNVLSGSLNYYLKQGLDLFGSAPLPSSTGLISFYGNDSNTSGHGTGIAISSININSSNFKWLTSLYFAYVLDQVTRYSITPTAAQLTGAEGGNGGFGGSAAYPEIGKPLYGLYTYKFGGLTHDTGDPIGYLNGVQTTDYAAIISKSQISDLQYDGPSRPTTFGSLMNSFSYKQFTLSINIGYEFNFYFLKPSISNLSQVAGAGGGGVELGVTDYLKAWQKPGDETHTNVPSLQNPPGDYNRQTFYEFSSALVDKGDNIRLRDINLSYRFDKQQIRSIPFSYLEIYTYINNLGILWRANKDGIDPDLYGNTAYPVPRTIAFGIRGNFK